MKRWPALFALACVCGLAIHSDAQQGAEGRPEQRDQRGGGGDAARPDPGRDAGGAAPRIDGGGPGGIGRPEGRPRLPEGMTPEMIRRYMEMRAQMGPGAGQLDAMRNYLDVFDRYSRLSRDPTAAGVSAVVSIPGVPQMPNGELPAPNTGEQPLFLPSLPSFPSLGEVIGGPSQSNESPNESAKARESL